MEIQFTQAELDTYLETLDLTNPSINKVFNSIQLLSRDNYIGILHFLVSGKINISSLFNVSINNLSIATLIDSLEKQSNTANINIYKYYIDFISTLPLYNGFMKLVYENSSIYLYKLMTSSKDYVIEYTIDPTGLTGDFQSIVSLKNRYSAYITNSFTSPEYIAFKNKANSLGMMNIHDMAVNELLDYVLITTKDKSLPIKMGIDTLCGFTVRGLTSDIFRYRYNENFQKLLRYMVSNYNNDIEMNGEAGLLKSNSENRYENIIANSTSPSELFEELSYTALSRYIFTNVYGEALFGKEFIDNENSTYDSLFNKDGLFNLLEIYITKLISDIRINGI
jgi:hypothetical protein